MFNQECKNIILITVIGEYLMYTGGCLKISRTAFINKTT